MDAPGLAIRPYRRSDCPHVVALWHACDLVVPWNDPERDIETKIAFQAELFLVGEHAGELVASVMVGYEGHRGWINYLAVAPAHRRAGAGRQMMEHAENVLRRLGCPKINLQVRAGNQDVVRFYEGLGFARDDSISLGKRIG